ncbi:COBRA-like protein 1 [Phalaenopsis equestris]|uniref:COBRA-like protein 1 n=1 Tax=Phalaenopsis equestris TaxID=78828 RepID=UPI0009E2F2CD|nr:COBRA-like protein 1 [Phalaenopsis equestris]
MYRRCPTILGGERSSPPPSSPISPIEPAASISTPLIESQPTEQSSQSCLHGEPTTEGCSASISCFFTGLTKTARAFNPTIVAQGAAAFAGAWAATASVVVEIPPTFVKDMTPLLGSVRAPATSYVQCGGKAPPYSTSCAAVVTINNYQQYRHIQSPGWILGWTWSKKEVIWSMVGAQTTEQGDCSKFKGNIPHCCKKDPSVVDLLPGTPYNMQIANCCKGGVISSWVQDPPNAISAFQLSVGQYHSLWLMQYALMTWNVTCTYSQFLSQKTPSCCVSLSSFYNDTIVNCPTCSCGCQNNVTHPGSCVEGDSPYLASVVNGPDKSSFAPLVQCTSHMCPIRIHWHVKLNYVEYWRVKITITNFNYRMNYTQWNFVAQHPNFNNLTEIFSFNYKSLTPYEAINDTGMFWGIKYYNDLLMTAGPSGNVQSEVLLRKDASTFTFEKGWAFPRRIYFNGDNCVMPSPDSYPWLPNGSSRPRSSLLLPMVILWAFLGLYA